ncbi:MAG: type III-B CRISPR module-associated protein Cmr3 [Candidatus Omnitrophica bacterium]|nr:type III-B CRISPR module-associated protein Cmr3 [Candidatus Omnitrophota bacterium]
MNIILLEPADVLFFRDGRPMSGSLAGHTAAWPLPDVTSHALHAALWRSGLANDAHPHRRGRSGSYSDQRDRRFGSLLSAGPFPVRVQGIGSAKAASANSREAISGNQTWFFPRPNDAQSDGSVKVTLRPAHPIFPDDDNDRPWRISNLPHPLTYAVANTKPPTKDAGGEPWISTMAFEDYLNDSTPNTPKSARLPCSEFLHDKDLAEIEHAIGIGIDPVTGTTGQGEAAGIIYSAQYLRLHEDCRLGLFAEAPDKLNGNPSAKRDLVAALLNNHSQSIIVGGQQRICTAHRSDVPESGLPLPRGLRQPAQFVELANGKFAVKWALLTPALWPKIPEGISRRKTTRTFHPGGWLPNWICPQSGDVLLETVSQDERRRRRRLHYEGKGYSSRPSRTARLVAALVPKPISVTGWALGNPADPERNPNGGAKPTHLAVPAGAVYYFEAQSREAAVALANALNWHGASDGTEIKNRRSTLLGEKGYGLGVCGTWKFYAGA